MERKFDVRFWMGEKLINSTAEFYYSTWWRIKYRAMVNENKDDVNTDAFSERIECTDDRCHRYDVKIVPRRF